jgi:hypothetical protein
MSEQQANTLHRLPRPNMFTTAVMSERVNIFVSDGKSP